MFLMNNKTKVVKEIKNEVEAGDYIRAGWVKTNIAPKENKVESAR